MDNTIKIWNANNVNLMKTLVAFNNSVTSLASLPNGYFATGSRSGVIIWDRVTCTDIRKLIVLRSDLFNCSFIEWLSSCWKAGTEESI